MVPFLSSIVTVQFLSFIKNLTSFMTFGISIMFIRVQITRLRYLMKHQQLSEKIVDLKAASNFEQKLIDSIYNIMQAKRKAEDDYKISLQGINRQLEKYILSQNGFLIEIVKSYQSYITVVHQNQKMLIDGYDQQILHFLRAAKENRFQENIIDKVNFVDKKVGECRDRIKQAKKLIKDNQEQLQLMDSQFKLKHRTGEMNEEQKKKFAEKFEDLTKLKEINQETLEAHVDSMMDLTMLHNQTLQEVANYETIHLQEKANQVFDNFMRAFVLEVSYIRNLQFDVTSILQKVKERQEQHRKLAMDALRARMKKQDSKIKRFFWDTYKGWTQGAFDINQPYINPRIKEKWKRVCQYYNKAC